METSENRLSDCTAGNNIDQPRTQGITLIPWVRGCNMNMKGLSGIYYFRHGLQNDISSKLFSSR